jgi:hypothetical protein
VRVLWLSATAKIPVGYVIASQSDVLHEQESTANLGGRFVVHTGSVRTIHLDVRCWRSFSSRRLRRMLRRVIQPTSGLCQDGEQDGQLGHRGMRR